MPDPGPSDILLSQATRAGDLFAEALARLITAAEGRGYKLTDSGWVAVGMMEAWRRVRSAEEGAYALGGAVTPQELPPDRIALHGSRVHLDYPLAYGCQTRGDRHDAGMTAPANPALGVTTSDDGGNW